MSFCEILGFPRKSKVCKFCSLPSSCGNPDKLLLAKLTIFNLLSCPISAGTPVSVLSDASNTSRLVSLRISPGNEPVSLLSLTLKVVTELSSKIFFGTSVRLLFDRSIVFPLLAVGAALCVVSAAVGDCVALVGVGVV